VPTCGRSRGEALRKSGAQACQPTGWFELRSAVPIRTWIAALNVCGPY